MRGLDPRGIKGTRPGTDPRSEAGQTKGFRAKRSGTRSSEQFGYHDWLDTTRAEDEHGVVAFGDIGKSEIIRRFDDATSEETAADCCGTCSDRCIAAKPRTARRGEI
jgi:hypothetical protein